MRLNRSDERRGVILMVVMAMLTLFAIVGISFVLYAQSEATSARVARESETAQRADMDPEECLTMFLGQLIYDVHDATGYGSGLRGHSLARTMYGYNSTASNITPFNGVGRLHTNGATWPYMNPYNLDDNLLVNYTWFAGDSFARDPEWYTNGMQTSPSAAKATGTGYYVGGNAPYTYPDLNNFFLAAVRSDGTVLTPSFHRPWLFNPGTTLNNMSNVNWTNRRGKYLTLRPRPNEHPNFPAPDDATGDVKNLVGGPGGNDSIWIDIGAPIMTAPDGTKYKMLIAPLIMDLDNRINVAACGNIAGNGNVSRSNQGWFASEINLGWLWNKSANAADWQKLFLGNGSYYGKYGPNLVPSAPLFPTGSAAHVYAPADLDGRDELAGNGATPAIQLPGTGGSAPATSCFPFFPQGYGSGSPQERLNHPAGYAAYKSSLYTASNDDLVFRPSDMEAILRPNSLGQPSVDTGSSALISNLLRLCPQSLGGTGANVPQRRNWITTISNDLAKPGVAPWSYNPLASPFLVNAAQPTLPPSGNPIAFPALAQRSQALPSGSEFTANWRALSAALGRIDLNRPLPPFPHMASGSTAALVAPNARFDTNAAAVIASNTAMQARQAFANSIYRALLLLTGVAPAANPKTPTVLELAPRRWLAQLAVNIVDYIDADEISTPFNFYTAADGATNIYQLTPTNTTIPAYAGGNPDVPAYWVFGTELPRVVINEVLGEYTLPTNNKTPPTAITGPFNVNLWVELFNPMPTGAAVTATATANQTTLQPLDSLPVPLYHVANGGNQAYNPYQLVIANNGEAIPPTYTAIVPNSHGLWYNVAALNSNVLGTAQHLRYATLPTAKLPNGVVAGCNFAAGGGMAWTVAAPPPAKPTYPITQPGGLPGQSYMIVGPSLNDVHNDIAANAPGTTPFLQSANMQYTVNYHAVKKQWHINGIQVGDNLNGVSVLLRRLANPHLPPNPYTAAGALTNPAWPPNPYVTVDYLHGVLLNGYGMNKVPLPVPISTLAALPPGNSPLPPASYGKLQPYAANFTQVAQQTTPKTGTVVAPPRTRHTLGLVNTPLANPFTWMVHLDRKLISPMELLHVSGFPNHDLTQRFIMVPNATSNPAILQPYNYIPAGGVANSAYFQHYVPWFDQTRRLYRLFELLEARDAASGISPVNGRVPGKININTMWDPPSTWPQMYQAIADPSATPDNPNFKIGSGNVTLSFQNLLTLRTPGLATATLSANDRPFFGMAAGVAPGSGTQYPTGNGINHTLLTGGSGAAATTPRLLQLPNTHPHQPQAGGAHPYLQNQLLTKVYNNFTTRSNTFAVFVTVGFFQVTGTVAGSTIPQLGAEIGRSEGRQVRHRMFALVDRTNLPMFTTSSSTVVPVPPSPSSPVTATIQLPALSGSNANTGAAWSIGVGTQLVIEPGTANEETVIVASVNAMTNQVTGNFLLQHPNPAVTGNPSLTYAISQRGNPGPWTRYDPRLDPAVVPYYSIID